MPSCLPVYCRRARSTRPLPVLLSVCTVSRSLSLALAGHHNLIKRIDHVLRHTSSHTNIIASVKPQGQIPEEAGRPSRPLSNECLECLVVFSAPYSEYAAVRVKECAGCQAASCKVPAGCWRGLSAWGVHARVRQADGATMRVRTLDGVRRLNRILRTLAVALELFRCLVRGSRSCWTATWHCQCRRPSCGSELPVDAWGGVGTG